MLKQEIIEKITKYFKLTHFEAEKIYDDIFQSIMQGVKEDNITEVGNLGEFIIKYGENGGSQKKTVEFLPSANLEDELNQSSAAYTPDDVVTKPEITEQTPQEILTETEFRETKKLIDETPPQPETTAHDLPVEGEDALSVEDELKKKREEIIQKLTPQHQEEYHHLLHVEGLPLNVPKPVVIEQPVEIEAKSKETLAPEEEIKSVVKEESKDEVEEVKPANEREQVEELTNKSFSDFFTELKTEKKPDISSKQAAETVIPPIAVNLHKEIVGEQTPPPPPPPPMPEIEPEVSVQDAPPVVKQNGNGYQTAADFQGKDDSYYIWYKDSEPNAVDTQTMSYEYELLYQATKEAEYKSKLRIYVTTFILFFSIVLLLLIFSPVIYKYFFNPEEQQTIEEYVPEEQSSTGQENSETAVTPSDQNTTLAQETNVPPPPASNEQMTQEPPAAENKEPQKEIKTEQEPASRQNEPPATQNTTPNIQGVVKTGLGWIDEKNRVIYVQLENGKFTIQESAWESDERARKRISAVGTFNIPGMTGSVFKADLGPKGIWYRARFGEFTTIEEAKQKAEELRGKEKMKLQAFLFSILMVA